MSFTLLYQLLQANRKRFTSIVLVVTLSLTLFIVITMIVKNVNQQILDQTKPLVGADIIIEWSKPLTGEALEFFQDLKNLYTLETTSLVEFSTNITFTWVDAKLTQVLWIDNTYPLYGQLDIRRLANTPSSWVFVDQDTYNQVTQDNSIRVGTQEFAIEWIIESLPWTSINLFDEWRTIIIPYAQVEATQLTQLWSRVEYETRIRTQSDTQTQAVLETLRETTLFEWNYEIENGARRIEQISQITTEFDRFITIVLIITFLLVTTTVFIAVRTFFTNQQKNIGILKILGQNNRGTLLTYGILFVSCFVISRLIACIVGRLCMNLIRMFPLASDFILYPSVWFQAWGCMLILASVSLTLPLSTIMTAHPLSLLRAWIDTTNHTVVRIQCIVTILGLLCIYIIALWDTLWWVLFVGVWSILFAMISWIIWLCVRTVVQLSIPLRRRYFMQFDWLRSMIAPWNQTVLLSIGILITVSSLLVISAFASSFLTQLQTISEDQPSLYVLNIVPEDLPIITQDYPNAILYDTILSRIQAVNAVSLGEHLENLNRWEWWRGGFTREFNVTSVLLDNESYLVWNAPTTWWVSLEQDFAERLWVRIGDTITFFIQWRSFDLELTSLRTIQRDGSWPFFYIQFPQSQFENAPKSFFWLVDIPLQDKDAFKNTLVERIWPSISFVDTDEIIATVTDITQQLMSVIRILIWFLMIFVLVSIIVSLDAMKSLKKQKVHLYTLLWATKKMIITSLRTEQIAIFGSAIVLSLGIASLLVSIVFMQTYLLSMSWWIIRESILLIILICVGIIGLIRGFYRDII